MDPREAAIQEYVDNAVAEAVAGGKSKDEAEALRPAATEEAKKIVDHPLFKKFEGAARRRFEEHDNLKKEVAPLKTAAQKLKDIEDANKSDVQKLTDEIAALKPGAARAEKLEARIKAILTAKMANLTDAQKAAIRGGTPEEQLEHLEAMEAAGLLGEQVAGRSLGGELPRKGRANTLTGEEYVGDGTSLDTFAKNQTAIKKGEKALVV